MTTGEMSAAPDCPRCGAPTVRRPVRRGPRAGLEMWGCSRYPDCTGLINIDPGPTTAPHPIAASTAAPSARQPAAYLQSQFERARERDRLRRRAFLPLFIGLSVLAMALIFFGLQPFGIVVASAGAVVTGAGAMFGLIRLPFESIVWARGIEGERKSGDVLAGLEPEGFVTLYNRRVPGAKGDIDAVTIGPTGVFVIETKNWSGKLEVHRDRLWVGDHDRTWVVEQLYREALAVQLALGEELTAHRVTVAPVLCVIGGIVRGASRSVAGVSITDAKSLAGAICGRPAVFDETQVGDLARAAADRLRQAMPWEAGD